MDEVEEWRPIKGWGNRYEVSSRGRVRSLFYVNAYEPPRRLAEPRILSPWRAKNTRYMMVRLTCDGAHKNKSIHRLVLVAFRGDPPPGHEGAHLDGSRDNNRLDNLAWTTKKENHAHKIKHGTAARGEKNYRAILSDTAVREIRREYVRGSSHANQRILGEKFGVTKDAISLVITGKNWAHVID